MHKGIGDLRPRHMEVAPEGLSGDAEDVSSLLLFEPHKIDEPQGLHLFGEEEDELVEIPTEGGETPERALVPDPPADTGAPPPATAASLAGHILIHTIDLLR